MVVLAGVAVLVLLLAVVAAARSGTSDLRAPQQQAPVQAPAAGIPALPTLSAAPPQAPRDPPGWVLWVFVGIAALVALALIGLVARAVARLLRGLIGRRAPRAAVPPAAGPRVGPGTDVGEELRERVAAAAEGLQVAAGPPADAVVACWLDLESTAAATGGRRTPSQTPTEFTAALLRQHLSGAAGAELTSLLTLYHRARFSSRPVTADDVAAAQWSLAVIADSLGPAADDAPAGHPAAPDRRSPR